MGNSNTTPGQVISKDKGSNAQNVLPEEPPYPGPSAQYHFVNTEVTIGTQMTFSFTSSPMVTSNIDAYYPVLSDLYNQGFRLLSFYRIPGQMERNGLFSTSVRLTFQGIFCRYPEVPHTKNWQLRIEKSVIQAQHMFTGIISMQQQRNVVSDTSHILESIARNTQAGGRLLCIEMTGQQQSHQMGQAMTGLSPLMGVDLFFEIPSQAVSERYIYNCISVPINVVYQQQGFRVLPVVVCNWMEILATHLNQGWRLIEIFMDMSSFSQAHGFQTTVALNSMWFFEKPASRMNDPTPRYQGTFIMHEIKMKAGFGSVHTAANWEPVIQGMGTRGWELACILETPEQHVVGMTTVVQKCLLFFQRPLLGQPGAGNMSHARESPPSYEDTMLGKNQGNPPPAGFNVPPPPKKMGY